MEPTNLRLRISLYAVGVTQLVFGLVFLVPDPPATGLLGLRPPAPHWATWLLTMMAARFLGYAVGMFAAARAPRQHLAWINTMIVVQVVDCVATLTYLATGTLTLHQVSTAAILPPCSSRRCCGGTLDATGTAMGNTYRVLYRIGLLPWAGARMPPELVALAENIEPGVAVDLGCGTGTQARYLADRGWQVTAVDFIPDALRRSRRDDPGNRVRWRLADVTDTRQVDPDGSLTGRVGLVLDFGCLHGIPTSGRRGWTATVNHLALPAANLLVRAAMPARRGPGPPASPRQQSPRYSATVGTQHRRTVTGGTTTGWRPGDSVGRGRVRRPRAAGWWY